MHSKDDLFDYCVPGALRKMTNQGTVGDHWVCDRCKKVTSVFFEHKIRVLDLETGTIKGHPV